MRKTMLGVGCWLALAALAGAQDSPKTVLDNVKADFARGDFSAIIGKCSQVLPALEQRGQKDYETGQLYLYHGLACMKLDRLGEARQSFSKNVALYRTPGVLDASLQQMPLAIALKFLGKAAQQQADFEAAENHFADALAIRGQAQPKDPWDAVENRWEMTVLRNNVANVKEFVGQFDEAQASYSQAVREAEALLTKYKPILQQLAADKTRPNTSKAAGEMLQRYRLDLAAFRNNQGWLLHARKDLAGARELIDLALTTREEIHGKGTPEPELAESYNNRGMVHFSLGQYQKALDDLKESWQLYEEHYKQQKVARHTRIGLVLLNISGVLRSMGSQARLQKQNPAAFFEDAQKYLRAARPHYEDTLGRGHVDTAVIEFNQACLDAARGNSAQAAEAMTRARRVLHEHIRTVVAARPEREQIDFLLNRDRKWFHAALSMGGRFAQDPAAAAASAEWLLNGKMATQQTLAERLLLERDVGRVPAARDVLTRLTQVRGELAAVSLPLSSFQAARARRASLEQQEAALSRELLRLTGGQGGDDPWIDLNRVRARVPDGAVLVEIVRCEFKDFTRPGPDFESAGPHYLAWIIPPPGGAAVTVVALGPAEPIDAGARAVADHMKRFATESTKSDDWRTLHEQCLKQLAQIARLVLQPVVQRLTGSEQRLIISPDGELWQVPWAALPLDGEYALKKFTLSYVATGRDLLPSRSANVASTAPVVVADVDYGQGNAPFKALAQSASEADAIGPELERWTGQAPLGLRKRLAQEAEFRKRANPRVAFLSTHGFFIKQEGVNNPLAWCGLAFAGGNQARSAQGSGAQDGWLLGTEVLQMDFRGTELVYLSACETGLGKVVEGEGVRSLHYAFQLAGARAVVATLWEVPDTEAALLSASFFREMADQPDRDKAEALRAAQLSLIDEHELVAGYAHPFFWAAPTLVGKWTAKD